jgi:tetratricopeptide (TPR) repeat protein
VLCWILVGSSFQFAGADEHSLPQRNDLQQFAQAKPHQEHEAKKEPSRSEAAKRQTLFRHRVEQLRKAGQHAVAIPMAQRSLALAERRHGREHPNVATALNTLGSLYAREHRYAEAEQAYKRALEIREKTLGPDHPDTAASLNKLAGLYQEQGKHSLAEQYYKRALAIQEKLLASDPKNAPEVATTLSNLASVYQSEGRATEAAQLSEQAGSLRQHAASPSAANENKPRERMFHAEKRSAPGPQLGTQPEANPQPQAQSSPEVAAPRAESKNSTAPITSQGQPSAG